MTPGKHEDVALCGGTYRVEVPPEGTTIAKKDHGNGAINCCLNQTAMEQAPSKNIMQYGFKTDLPRCYDITVNIGKDGQRNVVVTTGQRNVSMFTSRLKDV